MTPTDHNKVIGIMHLIYGGFNALMMLLFLPFILILLGPMGSDPTAPAELKTIFAVFGVFIIGLTLVFSIPPLLAGYAMLQRKSWARVAGVIAACVEALSMPFGTALCVYTLWFLFGQGEGVYRGGGNMTGPGWRPPHLHDANTFDWDAQRAQQSSRQREYVPPPQPPDWRGQ
jgi:hypothetical protein